MTRNRRTRPVLILAPLAIAAATTIAACGPRTAVGAVKCATNPATGHLFANVADAGSCPGAILVDVDCGPLTIATGEDDGCVRANIVGDGTSTGVRGPSIVPLWYVNTADGDTVTGVVE